MFWIVLMTIFGILGTIQINRLHKDTTQTNLSVYGVICVIITISSIILTLVQGLAGMSYYPDLEKRLGQIEALQNRVKDIKESKYRYEKDGNFVAGSVENINQSTNLSKYITDLAMREAEYKGNLREYKAHKEIFSLYFFGLGWAISEEIYSLPTLE